MYLVRHGDLGRKLDDGHAFQGTCNERCIVTRECERTDLHASYEIHVS